ncbi:MAG TPA: hypothetical protein VML55_11165 [Planctomycetaceae bacterium]|nr:hypothetical protein [Planctomycetaceae bacterium]
MQRLTSLVVAGLCLCGSAAAQPGNLPAIGGGLNGSAHGGIGRPGVGAGATASGSLGAGWPGGGGRDPARLGSQFGTSADLRRPANGGFDSRVSAGAQLSSELRPRSEHGSQPGETAGSARATGRAWDDHAFDATTGGLTAEGRAELMLRNRLAAIDRLRDAALEHGDTELLDEADRLERQTRARFQGRGRVAGPSNPGADPAGYELDHATSTSVTPASGHPLGGFAADVAREAREDGRDFGLRTSAEAQAQGREFGDATATQARVQGHPANSAAHTSGGLRSHDWYNPQFQAQARARQVSSEASIHAESDDAVERRAPARHVAADAWTRNDGRLGAGASWPAGPGRPPVEARGSAAAATSLESGFAAGRDERRTNFEPLRNALGEADLAGDAEVNGRDFDGRGAAEAERSGYDFGQQTAAQARHHGHEFGPATAAEARLHGQAFGPAADAEARFPEPAFVQQAEDRNTIYYHRESAPAAHADFGQNTAAEARAAGRDFGQAASAEARSHTAARTGATAGDDRFESTFDGSAGSTIESGVRSRREPEVQPPPQRSTVPPQTEQPPKRGLFSWFRGRGRT